MLQNKCNNFQQVKNGGAVSVQQKRNKKGLSDRHKRLWSQIRAESGATRQAAIDLFEGKLAYYLGENPDDDIHSDEVIELRLPLKAALEVLDLAKKSLHKGLGRSHPKRNASEPSRRRSMVEWARDRKKVLRLEGMTARDAEEQATREASKRYYQEYGVNLADSTFK